MRLLCHSASDYRGRSGVLFSLQRAGARYWRIWVLQGQVYDVAQDPDRFCCVPPFSKGCLPRPTSQFILDTAFSRLEVNEQERGIDEKCQTLAAISLGDKSGCREDPPRRRPPPSRICPVWMRFWAASAAFCLATCSGRSRAYVPPPSLFPSE